MSNRLYILFMIFVIIIIMIVTPNYSIESFGCEWWDGACKAREAWEWAQAQARRAWQMALDGAMRDVNRMINQLKGFTNTVNNLPRTVAGGAKNVADSVINTALVAPRHTAKTIQDSLKGFQANTTNLFKTVKLLFEKLKYFTELLMITVNRAKVCSEGADKVLKNYALQTNAILTKVSEIHKKIRICPEFLSSLKTPATYYKDCISQIIPLIKSCYKYVKILIKFYKEVLTYEELFPQTADDKNYCATRHKNVRSKKDSIEYAKRCNYCLHLKSVLTLGLGELNEFASSIKLLSDKGTALQNALGKLVIKI